MEIEDLEILQHSLQTELNKVRDELIIRRKALRPMTTQNRLIVIEGQPFWAIGYRNHIYETGHWSVRFTNQEQRAYRMLNVAKCQDLSSGQHQLFNFQFPVLQEVNHGTANS